jgi:hypothetical protein
VCVPDQVELHGEGSELVCFTGVLDPEPGVDGDGEPNHDRHTLRQRAALICEGRGVVRGVRVAPHTPLPSPLGTKPSPDMCAAVILNAPPEHHQGQTVSERRRERARKGRCFNV